MRIAKRWFFLIQCLFFSSLIADNNDSKIKTLISHIEMSIQHAEKGISQLQPSHLAIKGFSSNRVRHFLNNLCSLKNSVYLEIGCWHGSTLIAATYENVFRDVIAIDDWSGFNGPRKQFFRNIARFVPKVNIRVIESDCFSLNKTDIFHTPVTIYFYDGGHSEQNQKDAFVFFDSVFDDLFIAVVDDWNWSEVRKGTFAAFAELNYDILYSRELPARWNGDTALWWNGIYVALIRKHP